MPEKEYLFIDGGYLRKVFEDFSRNYFDGFPLVLNYKALFNVFYKSFYYDCLPDQIKGETNENYSHRFQEREDFFLEIQAIQGVHLFEGVLRGKKTVRQKTIDVAIAVDMLTHSHRRNMDRATLLAGDLDFKPLVDALIYDGMYVTIWFEPTSASKDLILSADNQRPITIRTLWPLLSQSTLEVFPEPQIYTEIPKVRPFPLKIGKSKSGLELSLFGLSDHFEIVSLRNQSDHVGVLTHPNKDFLLRYANFYFNGITWEN